MDEKSLDCLNLNKLPLLLRKWYFLLPRNRDSVPIPLSRDVIPDSTSNLRKSQDSAAARSVNTNLKFLSGHSLVESSVCLEFGMCRFTAVKTTSQCWRCRAKLWIFTDVVLFWLLWMVNTTTSHRPIPTSDGPFRPAYPQFHIDSVNTLRPTTDRCPMELTVSSRWKNVRHFNFDSGIKYVIGAWCALNVPISTILLTIKIKCRMKLRRADCSTCPGVDRFSVDERLFLYFSFYSPKANHLNQLNDTQLAVEMECMPQESHALRRVDCWSNFARQKEKVKYSLTHRRCCERRHIMQQKISVHSDEIQFDMRFSPVSSSFFFFF